MPKNSNVMGFSGSVNGTTKTQVFWILVFANVNGPIVTVCCHNSMCGHGGMCAPSPQKIMLNVNQTDKGKLVHPTKKQAPPPSLENQS